MKAQTPRLCPIGRPLFRLDLNAKCGAPRTAPWQSTIPLRSLPVATFMPSPPFATRSSAMPRDAYAKRLFSFTAALNRASKRYQWNAKRPTNVMTGTLYISSLRYEWNVWSLFRRKAADVLRYYSAFPSTQAKVDVFQRSATDLDCLPDRSIDMVFMDPPFESNIFYANSSLLWEAWLGQLTDEAAEIVVNKHRARAVGGKTVEDYCDLMRQSFEHAGRVLRPDGHAILAFSNSDDQVWSAIQTALRDAGFETTKVHLLNKGQPSIKGVKGVTGKENVTTFDLVLCLKQNSNRVHKCSFPATAHFGRPGCS